MHKILDYQSNMNDMFYSERLLGCKAVLSIRNDERSVLYARN